MTTMTDTTARDRQEQALLAAFRRLSDARRAALVTALAVLTAPEDATNDGENGDLTPDAVAALAARRE